MLSMLSINERHSAGLIDDNPLLKQITEIKITIAKTRPIDAHITPAIASRITA